jgi:selenocysteine-specific elongation factor
VVREGPSLRLAGHRPVLPAQDAALLEQVRGRLESAGLRPPIVGELAAALGTDRASLLESLDRIARLGHLVRVAPNRFYLPATVDGLVEVARALAAESADGGFDAAAYRDRSGIGRNLTIEVLEFLDRSGHTRFARGRRWMSGPVSTGPGRSSRRPP